MTDILDGVRDHYRASGLTERLKTALRAFGPDEQRLTPLQLATLDQFHTRGLAATAELGGAHAVGKEGGVDAAEYDVRACRTGRHADFIAAERVARVDADADDVAGCDGRGIEALERFVDQAWITQ